MQKETNTEKAIYYNFTRFGDSSKELTMEYIAFLSPPTNHSNALYFLKRFIQINRLKKI